MNEKDIKYFDIAEYIATQFSKDTTKVGCIILDPETHQILATGYNGFPRKVEELLERTIRPEKYYWYEHAERNAIFHAARHGIKIDGACAYITMFPCADCARGLIQSGVTKIITRNPNSQNWEESYKRSKLMLEEANIIIQFID